MENTELRFEPIDLNAHAELCVKFRADSYLCSFGSAERFYGADGNGAERYLVWLKQRLLENPGYCVHVWKRGAIIGQMEMGRFKGDPTIGYVNLYYLEPESRNQGLGSFLDNYVVTFLASLGFRKVRLNVSPTNGQAVTFYVKHNWKDLGPQPDHPEVHLMEKELGYPHQGD